MKLIATEFRQDGFDFKLLRRDAQIALFRKTQPAISREFYEVVRLQVHPEKTWPDGRTSPLREAMPRSESWGVDGWSYSTLESAQNRFRKLCQA